MSLMQAGRGLTSYDSSELFAIAAYLYIESSRQTKEEVDARDTTIGRMSAADREADTGVPAVTELYRPADEMYAPQD